MLEFTPGINVPFVGKVSMDTPTAKLIPDTAKKLEEGKYDLNGDQQPDLFVYDLATLGAKQYVYSDQDHWYSVHTLGLPGAHVRAVEVVAKDFSSGTVITDRNG